MNYNQPYSDFCTSLSDIDSALVIAQKIKEHADKKDYTDLIDFLTDAKICIERASTDLVVKGDKHTKEADHSNSENMRSGRIRKVYLTGEELDALLG